MTGAQIALLIAATISGVAGLVCAKLEQAYGEGAEAVRWMIAQEVLQQWPIPEGAPPGEYGRISQERQDAIGQNLSINVEAAEMRVQSAAWQAGKKVTAALAAALYGLVWLIGQ